MEKMVKDIRHPKFESAERLTPLQLNGMKLDDKHTVLTPKKLEAMI